MFQNFDPTNAQFPLKGLLLGPVLWLRRLSLCLQCCHPIWILIQVPAALLPVQIPANVLGKLWKLAQILGLLSLMWKTWMEFQAPSIGLAKSQLLGLFGVGTNRWKIFLCISHHLFV